MINLDKLYAIFYDIQSIEPSSPEMHNYINALSREDYALLATAFELGRNGWERTYYGTNKFDEFIEDHAADGTEVTQKMLDDAFLPKRDRQKQANDMYSFKYNDANKFDGEYLHNWLSLKTNIITATYDGISMLREAF